jgi:hypothetical protein
VEVGHENMHNRSAELRKSHNKVDTKTKRCKKAEDIRGSQHAQQDTVYQITEGIIIHFRRTESRPSQKAISTV